MNDSAPESVRFFSFRPRLLEALRTYSREKFFADALAGLTVGVVALSLSIGLGIASGVSPQAGLYTGIIGGFLVSALGGSRVQIGGPAGAFVGLVALVASRYGLPNLLVCTMIAGTIMFLMGALRLGSLIRFIPQPVTMGFTCGIAITILTTQIRAFFGLQIEHEPAEFLPKLVALGKVAASANWQTILIGAASLAIIELWPKKWSRRVPGSIVAVVAGTVAVSVLGWPMVETIGSKYHGIPQGLPRPAWPDFDWRTLNVLIGPAFAIAMLGSIESLLSAVVADGLIDDRHDSNQELMAQGVANFVVPIFGGVPVTGVIARTATNIRNGAVSPVAGIVHALFLLFVLLVAAPLASDVPLATLAAVLIVVALRMGEWDEFRLLSRKPKSDGLVFLTTFVLTVCFDLTTAVQIGMMLAAALFVKRVADTTEIRTIAAEGEGAHEQVKNLPKEVVVYRVYGALLFGAADKLETVLRRAGGDLRVIILHMAAVTAMDSTALARLEELHEKLTRHKKHLILCGPHTQPYAVMDRAGFLERVGAENVVADLETAAARARELAATKRPPTRPPFATAA
ncbi:MAG TPA: SulP family inorganic anion transporter [Opitutaceae bacterium]|nr:SulP family inorganic anion transporter [Opitutaceae bacterium]